MHQKTASHTQVTYQCTVRCALQSFPHAREAGTLAETAPMALLKAISCPLKSYFLSPTREGRDPDPTNGGRCGGSWAGPSLASGVAGSGSFFPPTRNGFRYPALRHETGQLFDGARGSAWLSRQGEFRGPRVRRSIHKARNSQRIGPEQPTKRPETARKLGPETGADGGRDSENGLPAPLDISNERLRSDWRK